MKLRPTVTQRLGTGSSRKPYAQWLKLALPSSNPVEDRLQALLGPDAGSFANSLIDNRIANAAILTGLITFSAWNVITIDSEFWRGWTVWEIMYRVPLDNWNGYENAVAASPVPVKAAITGVTYFLGDWLAQGIQLSKQGNDWLDADRSRLVRSLVGAVLLGPLAHFYYDWIGPKDWNFLLKILVDQTAYLAVYNCVYYISLGVLAGDGSMAVQKLIRDFWPMQTAGWKLWPFIGLITYNFIPIQNRVLFIDMVEIFYSAILSLVANKAEDES